MRSIGALGAALAGAAAITIGTAAMAQQWPARSVLVVSPFAGGTTNDLVADIVLDHVGKQFGHPFVFENKPGNDGAVGVAAAVHAQPDGYTLLVSSSAMSSAVILHKTLPYDALHDLEPVAMLGGQPSVLLAAPQSGLKTVPDLVAAAKANPGTLRFASVGFGSASYFAGERFRVAAGVDVKHIPYNRGFDALNDLESGRVDFYFVPIPPALPLIAQNKAVPLAVTMSTRLGALPGVPTLTSFGYTVEPYLFWCGLSAPAKTPADIVDKLNAAIRSVFAIPGVINRFQQMGFAPTPMSPQQYGKFVADDMAAMIRLANEAHIAPAD